MDHPFIKGVAMCSWWDVSLCLQLRETVAGHSLGGREGGISTPSNAFLGGGGGSQAGRPLSQNCCAPLRTEHTALQVGLQSTSNIVPLTRDVSGPGLRSFSCFRQSVAFLFAFVILEKIIVGAVPEKDPPSGPRRYPLRSTGST